MGRSRWALPFALSLTFCILGVHPAGGTPGTKAGSLPPPGGPTGLVTPGAELWVGRFNGSANDYDSASALGVSPDGSTVFVTGSTLRSSGFSDYATVAHDASTGKRLWVHRYNGPRGRDDVASALGVSPDGSMVFVTGRSRGSTRDDYATVAYDASTGAQLWVGRYNGPGNFDDFPYALGVSPDGSKVFVTGASFALTIGNDYATVAYDASTGQELWVRRYNGPGNNYDYAYDVGVSPDGSTVFVTGASPGSTQSFDYATVAYDASTGTQLWVKRYQGPAGKDDYAYALGVSPDGSTVFVTGSSARSTGSYDYATVAYDASTGTQLWAKRYNSPVNGDDTAYALGVSPDGSKVFVTGSSSGAYATVAYDASTGLGLWVKRYKGPGKGDNQAYALGVSPDGSAVFVTGFSTGSTTSYDYATVAYDASTGAQLWVSPYNGPGNSVDEGYALGVSPEGSKVFVTGRSVGSTSSYDYATVAYSTS